MMHTILEKIFDTEIDEFKRVKYFVRGFCNIKEQKVVVDELKKTDTEEATKIIKNLKCDRKQRQFVFPIFPSSKVIRFQDLDTEYLKSMLEKALSDKGEKNLERWLVKRYFEFFIAVNGYKIDTPDSMFVMIKTILTLDGMARKDAMDVAFDLVEKRKILEAYKEKMSQKETPKGE